MIQIRDINWRHLNGEKFFPFIKLNENNLAESEQTFVHLQDGFNFNFKLSEEKFCVGYFTSGEFHKCPIDSILTNNSYTQCPTCEKIQGFKSAFLFGEEPNENAAKHLSQVHYIYLAFFAPDLIKVGTAAESRKFIRPVEQDALIFTFIATQDGFNIQKLEHTISKRFKIRETIQSAHKFKHISERPNFERAERSLKDNYRKIYSALHSEFKNWFYLEDELKIYNLSDNPEIFYPEKEVTKVRDDYHLVGKYKGLRGKYLIIENDEAYFAFNIKFLIGRNIESYVDDYRYKIESDQLKLI